MILNFCKIFPALYKNNMENVGKNIKIYIRNIYKRYLIKAGGKMKEVEKLVTENIGLVRHIAKQIDVPYIQQEDLVSEGTIGLIKAAQTFDENKKIKFSTYSAACIKNQMLMYLRKEKPFGEVRSIDFTIHEDKDGNKLALSDLIADEINYYEEIEINEILENALNWILNLEDSRARTILLLESAGVQQNVISEKLNISQSYISRIQRKMKNKLRMSMNSRKINNHICKITRKEGFYVIAFYKKNIKDNDNLLENIKHEQKKIDLKYFDVKNSENNIFEITLCEEENSMIFLADLLNQIA